MHLSFTPAPVLSSGIQEEGWARALHSPLAKHNCYKNVRKRKPQHSSQPWLKTGGLERGLTTDTHVEILWCGVVKAGLIWKLPSWQPSFPPFGTWTWWPCMRQGSWARWRWNEEQSWTIHPENQRGSRQQRIATGELLLYSGHAKENTRGCTASVMIGTGRTNWMEALSSRIITASFRTTEKRTAMSITLLQMTLIIGSRGLLQPTSVRRSEVYRKVHLVYGCETSTLKSAATTQDMRKSWGTKEQQW